MSSGVEGVSSSDVAKLQAMGFDQAQSTMALRKNGSVDRAVDWLLSSQGKAEASVRGNLALSAQQPTPRAAPQQQQQPQPAAFLASRIIQRAPVPAASVAAAVPAAASMSSPSAASSAALPVGYSRGTVKKFFDQADRLYGFIAVHDTKPGEWNFGSDAQHVLSTTSPPPGAGRPVFASQRASLEPYLTDGDVVSFRLVQREQGKLNAQEVRVIEYSRAMPPHKRKTQEQVSSGAIAPGGGAGGAAGGYAKNGAGPFVASAAVPTEIPSADLSTLVGSRLKGMVMSLDPSSGQPRSLPYGHLVLHHTATRKIIFLASEFREIKANAAAGMSAAALDAASAHRISTLVVGDVLEFTLACDPVLKFTAHDISLTPTLTYAQEVVSARSAREIAARKEAPRPQMRELLDSLPPLLIRGGEMIDDENRMLEFKALTRSSNVHNASRNLLVLADKYINSFLNSAGGVLMFGIEDNGAIVGLTFNKKDRDALRTQIDMLMRESSPPIDPQLYSIRFIPVRRLYKSSWASAGDDWLAGIRGAGHSPAALVRLMVSPDSDDRVEHLQDLCVVAIAVCAGESHVPFYTTSGRGVEGRDCYVRQEGSSVKMTPAMIAERTKARVAAAAAAIPDAAAARSEAMIASLLRDIEEQRAQAAAVAASAPQPLDIAKMVRELMDIERAKDAQEAAAAAAAVAASSAAAAAPAASSRRGSASAASASMVSQFGETSDASPSAATAAPASSSSSSVASIPKALLRVLQEMHFPRGDILDAVFELTETGKVDLNVFNEGVADSREAHQAISAVLDLLDQKKAAVAPNAAAAASSVPAAASMAASSSSSSSSALSSSRGEGEGFETLMDRYDRELLEAQQAAAEAAKAAAALSAPSPVAASPSASALSPSSSSFSSSSASAVPADRGEGMPAASAAPSAALADDSDDGRVVSDDSGPCEVCESLVPWVEYESHQELCRANRIRRDKEEAEQKAQARKQI